MKIYITGMPGSGKSTFGKKAAAVLQLKFIDLDKEIVAFEQSSISEIFDNKGEDYFREIESSLLKTISEKNENFLMATGGGAPCFFDNMEFMNRQGITFFIDAGIDHLLERISWKGINKRPLLKKIGEDNLEEGLRKKLEERYPFYSQAQITLPYQTCLERDIIEYIRSKR